MPNSIRFDGECPIRDFQDLSVIGAIIKAAGGELRVKYPAATLCSINVNYDAETKELVITAN